MTKSPFSFFSPERMAEMAEQAGKLLPDERSREEIQKSMHLMMQGALSRLDMVSREEFEAQKAVLEKTRAKVEKLEKEVSELAARLDR
jgi:BMFP domain-containing protein YqiC